MQCRPASWGGLEVERAPKRGQKATHHQIALEQFLRVGIIRWARQFPNRRDSCLQVRGWHTSIDALAQGGGILRLVEDDLTGFREHLRCGIQIMDRAQAFLLPFPCGLREGRPHEGIKKVEGIIMDHCQVGMGEGEQGCQLMILGELAQVVHLRSGGIAR